MKIMMSSCLAGVNCKYNGGNNRNDCLMSLLKEHEVILVCPEVLGGLPTPRACVEIKDGRAITQSGSDVSIQFHSGAKQALDIAYKEQVDLVILQSRSPSCGKGMRYSGNFDGQLVQGNGIFAQLCLKHGLLVMDVEEALSSAYLKSCNKIGLR